MNWMQCLRMHRKFESILIGAFIANMLKTNALKLEITAPFVTAAISKEQPH